MNGILKLPLVTTTALVLGFGTMSALADSPASGNGDPKSDQAKQHESTTASGGAASAMDAADDAGDAESTAAEAQAKATDDSPAGTDDAVTSRDVTADDVDADDIESADHAVAHSRSFTKSVETPHMAMSITHSIGLAKDEDGDMAMAGAMAKAQALDTPGKIRTDTMTKATVKVEGDAEAGATATAEAGVDDDGLSVETFGETRDLRTRPKHHRPAFRFNFCW